MQNKMLKTKRRQFSVVRPVNGYQTGRKVHQVRKRLKFWRVNVLTSEISDLEGVGLESLVLWKMTTEDIEELQQQVKQETLHKKRENIMPLTMQMSKDQIEKAYHSITEQWNDDVDGTGERERDDEECPDDCSDLEEENNNSEDADERNLTSGSDVESAYEISENCDLNSVDAVRTGLGDLLTRENIRSAELSCDRDDKVSCDRDGKVSCDRDGEVSCDRVDNVTQKSLGEFQTRCDVSSSKELSSIDPVCSDDSVSVRAEHDRLRSELEPCGIGNSENNERHDEICSLTLSNSVNEVIRLSVADNHDQIIDSAANDSGNYNTSLCQAVDLFPERKRVKLDENDACSQENKTFDLISTPSVVEMQQKGAEVTAGKKQSFSTESEHGDAYLEEITDHGNCDQVESHVDIGSGEPLKRVSVDLCRIENCGQPCCNKKPRHGMTNMNRCSLRSRLPTVGNHSQNLSFFQDRAKEFSALAVSDSESLLLLVNQAESSRKMCNVKAALKGNDSYTKICTKRGSCPVNYRDDCHSGNSWENSTPSESESVFSDTRINPDSVVDEVSSRDAALVYHNRNSCAESLSNDGLSKNIDAEKNDSKPISKPGNCPTIKLCEVDLFCREKRKLSSSSSSKSDEFRPQQNCALVQQNKKNCGDHVKPLKKRLGQKRTITAIDLAQSHKKDFSNAIEKSVADTNKRSKDSNELLLTLESTAHPVEKVGSTDVPAHNNNKLRDGIVNFQCRGQQQNSVIESDPRLESERNLAGISSQCTSEPDACLSSDRKDEHLASRIEFDMNFTQISMYKSEKNSCIENRRLNISNCSRNQDAVVDESLMYDMGIQKERLDFPRHLHAECGSNTVLRTNVMSNVEDISDSLSLIDTQHYNSNTVPAPAKDYDHDDLGYLQMVPCTNSKDSIEMVSRMYDTHVKDKLSQNETSSGHFSFETSRTPEELSSQSFVNIRGPCQSCHVDDVRDLEHDVSHVLDDSCKSDSCCDTLKTCVLGFKKDLSVILNSNEISESQSPGCGDLSTVAGDDGKMCSVDVISPIHSPSPCRSSSFFQNDSGVYEFEKSGAQRCPIIIPLTVGDQVTRDLLECLRTTKIRLLSESDEGVSNS